MSDPAPPRPEAVDVLVVGGGPAGLSAAAAARSAGAGRVLVIEREDAAGGVPRHCDHTGFGVRDLHRVLSGPRYARRIVERAADAGVEIVEQTMVTGWAGAREARVTGPAGVRTVAARAVILATGARERPRPARLVPGDRPAGVFTTGQLQQHVHLQHLDVGTHALVVGAEHVSYSALLTLRDAGVRTIGMVTALPRHQSFGVVAHAAKAGLRVPLWTSTVVGSIRGRDRVEAVELLEPSSGRTRTVAVDTVVFTGDWIPDQELARGAGVTIDRGTLGPAADQNGRTSVAGVWAAGNVVHPVEAADAVTARARHVGGAVAAWLRDPSAAPVAVPVVADAPLSWVAPNLVSVGRAPSASLLLRTSEFLSRPSILVEQGGRRLAHQRLFRAVPNRSHRIGADWMASVTADGGPVVVRVQR